MDGTKLFFEMTMKLTHTRDQPNYPYPKGARLKQKSMMLKETISGTTPKMKYLVWIFRIWVLPFA
jgi:hypothetical protein